MPPPNQWHAATQHVVKRHSQYIDVVVSGERVAVLDGNRDQLPDRWHEHRDPKLLHPRGVLRFDCFRLGTVAVELQMHERVQARRSGSASGSLVHVRQLLGTENAHSKEAQLTSHLRQAHQRAARVVFFIILIVRHCLVAGTKERERQPHIALHASCLVVHE